MKKKRRGFTLIETITTLFIMSLLAMLIVPNVGNVRETAKRRQGYALFQVIQGQVGLYQEITGKKKVSFSELVNQGLLTDEQVRAALGARIHIEEDHAVQTQEP